MGQTKMYEPPVRTHVYIVEIDAGGSYRESHRSLPKKRSSRKAVTEVTKEQEALLQKRMRWTAKAKQRRRQNQSEGREDGDISCECGDCSASFNFTIGEQEFFR